RLSGVDSQRARVHADRKHGQRARAVGRDDVALGVAGLAELARVSAKVAGRGHSYLPWLVFACASNELLAQAIRRLAWPELTRSRPRPPWTGTSPCRCPPWRRCAAPLDRRPLQSWSCWSRPSRRLRAASE